MTRLYRFGNLILGICLSKARPNFEIKLIV